MLSIKYGYFNFVDISCYGQLPRRLPTTPDFGVWALLSPPTAVSGQVCVQWEEGRGLGLHNEEVAWPPSLALESKGSVSVCGS